MYLSHMLVSLEVFHVSPVLAFMGRLDLFLPHQANSCSFHKKEDEQTVCMVILFAGMAMTHEVFGEARINGSKFSREKVIAIVFFLVRPTGASCRDLMPPDFTYFEDSR